MTSDDAKALKRKLLLLLSLFILARIILLILAPHDDPSEARYAEIARKMVETGNWITPQHDYGVPFWAKPPLSMWLSALGMECFGVNEFGSRIFTFLGAIGILLLVGRFAARTWSSAAGLSSALILMAMPLFFYCSAAVMTDLSLLFGVTLSMIAFIRSIRETSRTWGYLFFAGLAIGLLAKGPLALVIIAVPICGWTFLTRSYRSMWKSIPWIGGSVAMILLVLPWYIMAEHRTPGFLNYFIIGEHWNRFFKTGWSGDLYGKAHAEAPGTIWFYALLATFPLCIGLFALPFRNWRSFPRWLRDDHGLGLYLTLWAVWPLLFFTPARNVIATYPLPALPAIALLLARICHRPAAGKFHPLHPSIIAVSLFLVAGFSSLSLFFPEKSPKHSERELVRLFESLRQTEDGLIYYGRRKYSAEFYSSGSAGNTRSPEILADLLRKSGTLYVAISPSSFGKLPVGIRRQLRLVASFGEHASLYREQPPGDFGELLEASAN